MAEETSQNEGLYTLSPHKSKYRVATFSLMSPEFEEPVELNPIAINKILMVHDYDTCIQPIIKIECVLPPLVIDYINTHKSIVSFCIRFQKYDYIKAADSFEADKAFTPNGVEDIFNDKFVLFSPDLGHIDNVSEYQKVVETIKGKSDANIPYQLNKSGENFANYSSAYEFFIWKETDLYGLRAPVNAVFANVTIGDAAAAILSENGFKNVLMSPPQNTSSFGQLIIPPQSMMNVFFYLQRQYGMYDTDVIFFSDVYRQYILDKSGECNAYQENEYRKTVFAVYRSYNEDAYDLGTSTIDIKKEYYNKIDIDNVSKRSLSSLHDLIKGNTNSYIDAKTNEVTTVSGATTQRGEGCVNITTDQESTEYTKKKFTNIVSELEVNLKVNNLDHYNYLAMTPNKSFVFAFQEKEFYSLNGRYRLVRASHYFTRESQGELMAITGMFEFVRKKALSEDEYKEIQTTVFTTGNTTEEGKKEAEAKSDDVTSSEPSFQQSETNQVAEGKQQAAPTTPTGSSAPKDLSPNVADYNKISPNDDNGVINSKLIAQQKASDTNKANNVDKNKGSAPPTPLDEKKK